MSVMQRLYDSEINAAVSWLWDGRFDVRLGDGLNGWKAKDNVDTWADVEAWLTAKTIEHYPESKFAKDVAAHIARQKEALIAGREMPSFGLAPIKNEGQLMSITLPDGRRVATNGWQEPTCVTCGYNEAHDMHQGVKSDAGARHAFEYHILADHSHDSGELPRR